MKADGLLAACVQHEIDHLNGKLFIDYLSRAKRDLIIRKMTKDARLTAANKTSEAPRIVFMGSPDFAVPSLRLCRRI